MERNSYGRLVHGYSLDLFIWNRFTTALLLMLFVATLHAAELPLVENGRARAVIVLGSDAGPLVRKAAELLQSRVEQRTGARLPIVIDAATATQLSDATPRIVIATPDSSLLPALALPQRTTPSADELGEEGFFIAKSGSNIVLLAREGRGMIYAVGKLLHTAQYFGGSMFADPPQGIDKPLMPERVLYIPPHIHNFYEVKDAKSIEPIIGEMSLWGINGLSVWMDESEFNDPFDNSADNSGTRRLLAKTKGLLQIGKGLGLKLGMVNCPNDAYKNQVKPDLIAKSELPIWNQPKLINPTIPAGRALLIRNKENLYRDFANSGLRFDNVLYFAYDTGGCFDEACRPWILTFLKLTEDYISVLQRYHPTARAYITDWVANAEEDEMITDYLNQHPQTKIAGVWKEEGSSMEHYARLDKRYSLFIFVDVSMLGGWGTIGAQPFPGYLSHSVGDAAAGGITGVMMYSEGIFDDFNKAMVTQMAWNPLQTQREFAEEYASYFINTDIAPDFWQIVQNCERPWLVGEFNESPQDAEKLEQLTLSAGARLRPEIRSSWRWQIFEYRARIGKLAAALRSDQAFRNQILWALDAGVPADRLKRQVEEKQHALEQYQNLVTELREQVYGEPANRFPLMKIEDDFMTGPIHVPATRWREVLKELNAKLDAAAH
jgi:hypothetical protein